MLGYIYDPERTTNLIGEWSPDTYSFISEGLEYALEAVSKGVILRPAIRDATIGFLSKPVVTTQRVRVECYDCFSYRAFDCNTDNQRLLDALRLIFSIQGAYLRTQLSLSQVRAMVSGITYDTSATVEGFVLLESSRPPTQDEIKQRADEAHRFHRNRRLRPLRTPNT